MGDRILTYEDLIKAEIYLQAYGMSVRGLIDAKYKVVELEKKIVNLHAIITKKTAKIKRQAERITELEALYAGTKRSKKAANIKAKYKALKAYCEARDVR